MVKKEALKEKAKSEVETLLPRLVEMSDWIGEHPELGSEEYEASKLLADELEKHGFEVERGLHGMETAFRATYKGSAPGPRIAFLAEYDALPGVGHGCGHNIIGTAGIGAGIAASKLLEDAPGDVVVLGTPAEEGHGPSAGAKKRMAMEGVFEDIDVAWMIHPTVGLSSVSNGFLAVSGALIEFEGRPAHAAASPEHGVNALNAAMIMYMSVHANRQQLRRDANAVIHGIIMEGGLASNIIPDRAVLRFGVRSSDDSYIPELIKMVENSAKGAALATGCELKFTSGTGLKSNIRNPPLEELFVRVLTELDEEVEDPILTASRPPMGSTDFADVTHAAPGIHPMVSIGSRDIAGHSHEFAAASFTEKGHRGLEISAKAMAMAAAEVLSDPALLQEIKDAYEKASK